MSELIVPPHLAVNDSEVETLPNPVMNPRALGEQIFHLIVTNTAGPRDALPALAWASALAFCGTNDPVTENCVLWSYAATIMAHQVEIANALNAQPQVGREAVNDDI